MTSETKETTSNFTNTVSSEVTMFKDSDVIKTVNIRRGLQFEKLAEKVSKLEDELLVAIEEIDYENMTELYEDKHHVRRDEITRWCRIGQTQVQQGCMALRRACFSGKRVGDPK